MSLLALELALVPPVVLLYPESDPRESLLQAVGGQGPYGAHGAQGASQGILRWGAQLSQACALGAPTVPTVG